MFSVEAEYSISNTASEISSEAFATLIVSALVVLRNRKAPTLFCNFLSALQLRNKLKNTSMVNQ
jgi:hypothetical protein